MTYLKVVTTIAIVLLLQMGGLACHAAETRPQGWVRKGELDPGPKRISDRLPLSDQAATLQQEDRPGDGQDPTFVTGYGLMTPGFE